MSDPEYITAEGIEKIKTELAELKGPRRLALSARLRIAIEQGDLSENADYIQAKEEQGFLEGRIQELEYTLRNFKLIEKSHSKPEVVDLGTKVTLQEEGETEEEVFELVGIKETDPRAGRISNESPIGRAIIGKKIGENVTVETPGGTMKIKILNIE